MREMGAGSTCDTPQLAAGSFNPEPTYVYLYTPAWQWSLNVMSCSWCSSRINMSEPGLVSGAASTSWFPRSFAANQLVQRGHLPRGHLVRTAAARPP
jgi:hypothetical protein